MWRQMGERKKERRLMAQEWEREREEECIRKGLMRKSKVMGRGVWECKNR